MEHALDALLMIALLTTVLTATVLLDTHRAEGTACDSVAFTYSNGTLTITSGTYVTVIAYVNGTYRVYRAQTPASIYVGNATWVAVLNYCSYRVWGNFSGGCLCVTGYYPERRDTTCYCANG